MGFFVAIRGCSTAIFGCPCLFSGIFGNLDFRPWIGFRQPDGPPYGSDGGGELPPRPTFL